MSRPRATFINLPQEIRDQIYSCLDLGGTHLGDIRLGPDDVEGNGIWTEQTLRQYLDLPSTCRTMYHDLAPFFWPQNRFRILHTPGCWQPTLSSAAGRHISSIMLETADKWTDSRSEAMAIFVYGWKYEYWMTLSFTRRNDNEVFDVDFEVVNYDMERYIPDESCAWVTEVCRVARPRVDRVEEYMARKRDFNKRVMNVVAAEWLRVQRDVEEAALNFTKNVRRW